MPWRASNVPALSNAVVYDWLAEVVFGG